MTFNLFGGTLNPTQSIKLIAVMRVFVTVYVQFAFSKDVTDNNAVDKSSRQMSSTYANRPSAYRRKFKIFVYSSFFLFDDELLFQQN